MATKRRRANGSWEYRVQRAGLLPKPCYLTFEDESEGDAYVRRLEQLLDRGVVPPELLAAPAERLARLREVMVEYRASQPVSAADMDNLGVLLDRLAGVELRAINYAWADAWVMSMKRDANLSPSTIRHYVGALARCLDWAVRTGAMPTNPLRLLPRGFAQYTAEDAAVAVAQDGKAKRNEERDRRLVGDEEVRIREILAGAKPAGRERAFELREGEALRALFDLALESAMRLSEMYTLDVSQVDFERRTIFLDRTKNGSKRQVPMTSVAATVLREYLAGRGAGLVFPWWKGTREPAEMKRCTSMLSRQFGRIFDAAGCVDLRFHDLRHEATSRLYERTQLSDMEIAKITGHKSMRMLGRYANLRGSELAARLW